MDQESIQLSRRIPRCCNGCLVLEFVSFWPHVDVLLDVASFHCAWIGRMSPILVQSVTINVTLKMKGWAIQDRYLTFIWKVGQFKIANLRLYNIFQWQTIKPIFLTQSEDRDELFKSSLCVLKQTLVLMQYTTVYLRPSLKQVQMINRMVTANSSVQNPV